MLSSSPSPLFSGAHNTQQNAHAVTGTGQNARGVVSCILAIFALKQRQVLAFPVSNGVFLLQVATPCAVPLEQERVCCEIVCCEIADTCLDTSRVRLKTLPARAFFRRARSATMCGGSRMGPLDSVDKQVVVSSLDIGELRTKSDKGDGGVGP